MAAIFRYADTVYTGPVSNAIVLLFRSQTTRKNEIFTLACVSKANHSNNGFIMSIDLRLLACFGHSHYSDSIETDNFANKARLR
jgi:hypothetical protein